jgi:hypothetical protein
MPVEKVFDSGVAGVCGKAGRCSGQETAQGGGQGTGAAGQSRDLAEELCRFVAEDGLGLEGPGRGRVQQADAQLRLAGGKFGGGGRRSCGSTPLREGLDGRAVRSGRDHEAVRAPVEIPGVPVIRVRRLARVAERRREQEPSAIGVACHADVRIYGGLVPGNRDTGDGSEPAPGDRVGLGFQFFPAILTGQPAVERPKLRPVFAVLGQGGAHGLDGRFG